MRAKIMLLHFAPLLLLPLVDVRSADPIDSPKEMGSRSMVHRGNASVDFRFADEKLKSNGNRVTRIKRSDEDLWIRSEMDASDDFVKMHAFVVRDEDIPAAECDTPTDKVTKRRYFMCSGVILDENHVLTSATCVNQAHIHEYRIEADLAVLIGALDENSYAIRIAHYEIHPRYVPDPDSMQHATNNIALLRLACSIPRKYVVVPRLPFKRFEDVAHLCCPDRCKMTTVIENSENQHFLRLMKLKHLPSPMHADTRNSSVGHKKRNAVSSNLPPDDKDEEETANKELILRILRNRSVRQLISDNAKTTNLSNFSRSSDMLGVKTLENADGRRNNNKKSVNLFEDDDGAIDWENVQMEIYAAKVSEKNQKLLSNFVQNSMSDIMTKLLEVVTHHIADMNNVFGYFQSVLQEEVFRGEDSNQKISDLVGRSLLKFALEKMSMIPDLSVINCKQDCSKCINPDIVNVRNHLGNTNDETTSYNTGAMKDDGSARSNKGQSEIIIGQEGERLLDKDGNVVVHDNVFCPPLGSPVVAHNTLVGLIAYTCDDAQNWVEWKYVNIIQNIRWIRKELSRNLTEILQDSDTPHMNRK